MKVQDVPPRDHIPGREVLQYHPRQGTQVRGIHLHQVPRLLGRIPLGLTHPIGPGPLPPPGGDQPQGLPKKPSALQVAEDTPHHGGGDPPAFLTQQHHQLILPPARVGLPEPQHRLYQLWAPGGPAQPLGSTGVVLQGPQVPGIVAPLPAVEGLRADAEVAAGQAGVPAMPLVVVEPLKSLPGCSG